MEKIVDSLYALSRVQALYAGRGILFIGAIMQSWPIFLFGLAYAACGHWIKMVREGKDKKLGLL